MLFKLNEAKVVTDMSLNQH